MFPRHPARPRRRPVALLAALLVSALGLPVTAVAAERVEVRVEGLPRALRNNVLANLSIEQTRRDKDRAKELTEGEIRRLHTQANQEIEEALQPFGFYRPVVQASLEREGGSRGAWVARYEIEAGPEIKVARTDVQVTGEGSADEGFTRIVRDFPLQQGDVLLHGEYEEGKAAFDDYAATHGYLDAAFEVSEIRVDLAAYNADVVLHYTTGPRFLFGETVFRQDFLDPALVRGYVTWERGKPLSTDELLKVQNALSSSPYFARVEVVPQREEAVGREVPIVIELTPSKRQRWTAGLGYGTDTGPRGNAGLEVRRINRLGHRANTETRLSEIEKSISGNYEIPGPYPRTDVLTFTLGYAELRPETSTSDSFLARVGQARALGRWRQTVALDYQRADFTVGVDEGISDLLTPQASWSRVWSDDRIYPSRGERVDLDVRGASEDVLSNATFAQARARGKFIRSFGARRFRLINRGEVGYIETSQFRELPPTVRFFAGGDQSVRGYAYQDLGQRDELGNVIGGQTLAVASAEVEVRFLQKWGVAAFYDIGNAAESLGEDLKVGTGLGVRWLSPIGMVRVDAAAAVREPGSPVRFHLTLGPDL